jgi:4a-hydroxytetrahydrobiopterin dehydratase
MLSSPCAYPFVRDSKHPRKAGVGNLLHAGVDGWVVLHGGAMTVFRVDAIGEAADLAAAVAEVPDLEAAGSMLTITADRLTVRLCVGVLQLEPTHVDLARVSRRWPDLAASSLTAPQRRKCRSRSRTSPATSTWVLARLLGYDALADDTR